MNFRRYIPHLDLWLDIWLIQVQTQILYRSHEDRTDRWVQLRLSFFYKYGFSFRLYRLFP